jgi:hypothetical protein
MPHIDEFEEKIFRFGGLTPVDLEGFIDADKRMWVLTANCADVFGKERHILRDIAAGKSEHATKMQEYLDNAQPLTGYQKGKPPMMVTCGAALTLVKYLAERNHPLATELVGMPLHPLHKPKLPAGGKRLHEPLGADSPPYPYLSRRLYVLLKLAPGILGTDGYREKQIKRQKEQLKEELEMVRRDEWDSPQAMEAELASVRRNYAANVQQIEFEYDQAKRGFEWARNKLMEQGDDADMTFDAQVPDESGRIFVYPGTKVTNASFDSLVIHVKGMVY